MSGSTENLLKNSHASTSRESLDEQDHGGHSRQTKASKQGTTSGMDNKGYLDDQRELKDNYPSEIYIPIEKQNHHKRATSFQQKSIVSPAKENRRHSSPDYGGNYQGRNRWRQSVGRHRLSSNSEEDLRRKAFLNSMKKYRSANPLPGSRDDQAFYHPSTAQNKAKQPYIEDEGKIPSLEGHSSQSFSVNDKGSLSGGPQQFSTSPHQLQEQDELQNMQKKVLALEISQLEQYKRRLTLALSERAKLAGELKVLSQNLSQTNIESDAEHSRREQLPSSSRRTVSPTLSHSLGDLSNPEVYRDGDISVDYENYLRLPVIPASSKHNRRTKTEVPVLDLASLNSSIERISADDLKQREAFPEDKVSADTEATAKSLQGLEYSKDLEKKEDLKKIADDIWQDNMRGDVLAEERQEPEVSEKQTANRKDKEFDFNNNENDSIKRLTVEQFLINEDAINQQNKKVKIQPQKELNVLIDYEDINNPWPSRVNSPDLYEPFDEGSVGKQIPLTERQNKTPNNYGLLRLKEDEGSQRQENLENYFNSSTLPVGEKESKKDAAFFDRGKEEQSLRRETAPNEHQPHTTKLRRNERRFDYMIPPGTRRMNVSITGNNNVHGNQRGTEMADERELHKPPSNISDKLRYYRERLSNCMEEDTSCDLADAYAKEKDPEKRREIQQQAASEAAILRREASALLWEAINLERICDPNGRVRHVYLPH